MGADAEAEAHIYIFFLVESHLINRNSNRIIHQPNHLLTDSLTESMIASLTHQLAN